MTQYSTGRRLRTAALVGIAGFTLAACSSGTDASRAMDTVAVAEQAAAPAEDAPMAEAPAELQAADDAAAEDTAATEQGGGAPGAGGTLAATAIAADRDVIRTATVGVTVEVPTTGDDDADTAALRDAVTDAALKVRALVGAEGYVSASDSSGRVAVVTLRIPAAGYQPALDGLATVGTVTSLQEQAQDVTAQMVDLESRIATMTASVDRVRALLAEAVDLEDVVSLESELARRGADLESIQQQRAALSGQAALSTVTVTLTGTVTGLEAAVVEEPAQEATGFLGGLSKGWDAFLGFGAAALAVIGAVLPFVPVIAVVVLLAWLLFRAVARRTQTQVVPAGPAVSPAEEPALSPR